MHLFNVLLNHFNSVSDIDQHTLECVIQFIKQRCINSELSCEYDHYHYCTDMHGGHHQFIPSQAHIRERLELVYTSLDLMDPLPDQPQTVLTEKTPKLGPKRAPDIHRFRFIDSKVSL